MARCPTPTAKPWRTRYRELWIAWFPRPTWPIAVFTYLLAPQPPRSPLHLIQVRRQATNTTATATSTRRPLAMVSQSPSMSLATNQLRQAFDYLTQQRAFYGNVASQINSQESFLQSETTNIKSEENSLVG